MSHLARQYADVHEAEICKPQQRQEQGMQIKDLLAFLRNDLSCLILSSTQKVVVWVRIPGMGRGFLLSN
jgi:hypothetical protein